MKKLNTTSIASSPIFSLEKGEIDEIKNFTLKHATIVPAEESECMVAVTFNESNKRYWASGNFAEFITDNYDVDKVNETDLDFTPYGITVTFAGKKTSKNNRKYNSWTIGYNCIEWLTHGKKYKTNVNKRNYCCIANNMYNILIC